MNDKKSLYGLFTYKPESKYENNNYKWFFKLIAEMLCSEDIKFKKMRQEYDKFLWYMEHEKKYRNDEKKKYVLETAQRRMEKFRKDLLENLTYDRDSINTFQQQELYLAFKSVFASRKGWDELFHFYITNIEGKPNDKHSDSDRGIRFWNNSYGALCKQEISDAVNAIIEDIKDTINRYIDILHGKNALINCFLFPLENMLKDIENLKNNQSKKMDAVSAQSHEIAKLIYPREYAFGSEKRFVDKRLTEISTLYASVFTEALVLCLLFGGIDAFGNHQFIDNYVENRLGSAETIDFEISGENGIIFSLNKFNKEGKKIDISKPQI